MKRILLLLFLSFIFIFLLFTGSSSIASDQMSDGDLNQKDLIIKTKYNPADFAGSYVVMGFVSCYCQQCIKTVLNLNKLNKKYNGSDIKVVGIYVDETTDENKLRKFAEEHHISYALYMHNDEITRKYNIIFIPTILIFDTTGKVVKTYLGHRQEKVFEKDLMELHKKYFSETSLT